MISNDTIQKLANKHQTTELNIRREYVQHVFLSYFYQQPNTDTTFFKGGTALRIVYNSPRFSEDLDFNTKMQDMKGIEDAIIGTVKDIEHEGISVSVEESKETSGGYLGIVHFKLAEQIIKIQLEISFRHDDSTGEFSTIASDFVLPYTLMQLSQEQLIAEKIQALLSRKKPRDYYDLYFILRANLLPPAERSILPQALQSLKESDINFEGELKQFLPKSHWAIIRDFNNTLAREIERFI